MTIATALTDLVAAPLFRTDAEGRRVFAPNAITPDRFLIPDAQTEARLRKRMATLMGVSIVISTVLIVASMIAFGSPREWTGLEWLGIGSAFAVHFIVNIRLGRGLAAGLAKTEPAAPVGFLHSIVEQAAAWPRWLCWLELIVGPLVLIGGIFGTPDHATTYDVILSIAAVPLAFLMIGYGLAGLLGRRQSARKDAVKA